jgi:hypothetical protein
MDFGWIPYLHSQGAATGYDLNISNLLQQCHSILQHVTAMGFTLYIKCPKDLLPIASGISKGMAIAVTGRSFKVQRGISAFTLVDLALSTQLTGANHIPGLSSNHFLYRSELSGILGTVILNDIVCGFF